MPRPKKPTEVWDAERARKEYALIQAELALSKSDEPYMALDLRREELQLRLKGVVVWAYPLDIAGADSEAVEEFVDDFLGKNGYLARTVTDKHLFAAKEKTPDSVLAIVAEVVKADPELLQRDVPERFRINWGRGLVLEVRTEIYGRPKSKIKNTTVFMRDVLHRPLGEARIAVKMDPEAALTLFRATRPGMVTLLFPR